MKYPGPIPCPQCRKNNSLPRDRSSKYPLGMLAQCGGRHLLRLVCNYCQSRLTTMDGTIWLKTWAREMEQLVPSTENDYHDLPGM